MRNIIGSIILIIIPLFSSAQTCCSGGVPLSNNLGLPNEGKGIFIIGLNYDYNNLNTLNAGSRELDDDSRQRITNSVLLNLGYSLTDRISFETLFTWVNQTRTINQFGFENFTETSGIGDAVFLVKYSMPELLGSFSVINYGLGVKAPLGKSDHTTPNGIQLTADLQPGSGAWDGLGWVSISKGLDFRPSAAISGSLTYRLPGKNNSYLNNTAVYQFGNELQANLGYSDQVIILGALVNPGLIFKYRNVLEDEIDGQEIPNTGGEWVFVRPELTIPIQQKFHLSTRVELPLYSFVEGTQLTPTARISIGVSYQFSKEKNDFPLNNTL